MHRYTWQRSYLPSAPPTLYRPHFLFLEVCCPRNPFPFKQFLDAATNFHSRHGVPPQALPGAAHFHLFRVPEKQGEEEPCRHLGDFHEHDGLLSSCSLEAWACL